MPPFLPIKAIWRTKLSHGANGVPAAPEPNSHCPCCCEQPGEARGIANGSGRGEGPVPPGAVTGVVGGGAAGREPHYTFLPRKERPLEASGVWKYSHRQVLGLRERLTDGCISAQPPWPLFSGTLQSQLDTPERLASLPPFSTQLTIPKFGTQRKKLSYCGSGHSACLVRERKTKS